MMISTVVCTAIAWFIILLIVIILAAFFNWLSNLCFRQFFPYHPQFQIDSDPERGNGRPNPRMSIFDPRYLERVHPNNIEIYWGIVQGLHPVISKLPPPVEYDKRMNHSTECAICLEDFKDGEFCRILRCKCNNVFHQRCIDRWLLQMHTCPVCRVRV